MEQSAPAAEGRNFGRFSVLLGALLALMITLPFTGGSFLQMTRFRLLWAAILVVAVFTVTRVPWMRIVGTGLACTSIAGSFLHYAYRIPLANAIGYGVGAVFLGLGAWTILISLLDKTKVTLDTVLGGVCVYLLIGVGFALVYLLVEHLAPGSIALGEVLGSGELAEARRSSLLLYYSFVTLATLGYGDVSPQTELTRMLSSGEAVIGQLYVAIFVARLVGLHITSHHE